MKTRWTAEGTRASNPSGVYYLTSERDVPRQLYAQARETWTHSLDRDNGDRRLALIGRTSNLDTIGWFLPSLGLQGRIALYDFIWVKTWTRLLCSFVPQWYAVLSRAVYPSRWRYAPRPWRRGDSTWWMVRGFTGEGGLLCVHERGVTEPDGTTEIRGKTRAPIGTPLAARSSAETLKRMEAKTSLPQKSTLDLCGGPGQAVGLV